MHINFEVQQTEPVSISQLPIIETLRNSPLILLMDDEVSRCVIDHLLLVYSSLPADIKQMLAVHEREWKFFSPSICRENQRYKRGLEVW